MHFWCKLQDRVAPSSGEAELKAVCKGFSGLIHLKNIAEFMRGEALNVLHGTDASACRGILLRHGAGTLKHLSARQLWVQEALEDYEIVTRKIRR